MFYADIWDFMMNSKYEITWKGLAVQNLMKILIKKSMVMRNGLDWQVRPVEPRNN